VRNFKKKGKKVLETSTNETTNEKEKSANEAKEGR
jgi:hypothetical protein